MPLDHTGTSGSSQNRARAGAVPAALTDTMQARTRQSLSLQATGVLLGALALLLAGMHYPSFSDTQGLLDTGYSIFAATVVAGSVLCATAFTVLGAAGRWFALFLLGQAAILHFIDAGTRIHYQHSRLIHGVTDTPDIAMLAILGLQALIILTGLARNAADVRRLLTGHVGLPRTLLALLVVTVLATFPSRAPAEFAAELAINGVLITVQLACLLLGVLALPRAATTTLATRANRWLAGTGPAGNGPDRLAWLCAGWTLVITILLAVYAYERHPHIADEVAYIFHANYFAEGRLGTPVPPVPAAVESYLIDCDAGPCVSPVLPGWPAMLSLGVRAGADWLVNPVLSALNVLLLFMVLQGLYDRYAARLGVLLLAASPWCLLMGMSFMTHTFTLSCALLGTLAVLRMRRGDTLLWAVPGGIAIGLLGLTRPLDGLMAATVLGLAALFMHGRRPRLLPALALGLASIAVGVLVLPYNQALTGDPGTFPIMAYADKILGPGINALGFGADRGVHWGGLDPFPGHGLPDVIVNAGLNLVAINVEMFGWSIGSLIPVVLLLLLRPWRQLAMIDRWMLFTVIVIFAYQSVYWFSGGPDFGARYYFLVAIPVLALTLQALRSPVLGAVLTDGGSAQASGRTLAALLVLVLGATTAFLPWRAIDKYHHYRDMRPDIRHLIAAHDMGHDLLLISGRDHPDFNSAVVYTAIDPYGDRPVIALDKDAETRQQLLAAYPERRIWLIDGPSLTGSGYRVTAGPLNATDLLR